MMASRKSEAATQRPKQATAKNAGMKQFVLVGAVVVVAIVVALLLFGGGKKSARPKPSVAAAADTSMYGSARRPSARKSAAVAMNKANKAKAVHDSLTAKRHEERLKQEQATRTAGGRTTRNSKGGYTSGGNAVGGSSHVASTLNELRAILTDNSGARTALVGERRLKAGDDVEGHRILEVAGDAVKVEYGQNTYTVRVGEKIY